MLPRDWLTLVAFVGWSALGALGVLLAALGLLLEAVLPKIGYMVFKAQPSGSYSAAEYTLNLGPYYAVAALCALAGFGVAVLLATHAWRVGYPHSNERKHE